MSLDCADEVDDGAGSTVQSIHSRRVITEEYMGYRETKYEEDCQEAAIG